MELYFTAFGLMFLFEGVFLFLMPQEWRDSAQRMSAYSNERLRKIGLASALVGAGIIYLLR